MRKQTVAWIEIHDTQTGESIHTVQEFCESGDEALQQFRELDRLISAWTSSAEGLVLNTSAGWVRFPSDLITQSLIKLHIEEIDDYSDEVSCDENIDGE
jgi:hypothetical protein